MAEPTGTVVASFAELKHVLENTEEILVYLNADIQGEAGGIKTPNSKPSIIIDGTYGGVRHRYRDYSTYTTGYGLQTDTIRVSAPAGNTYTVTMQNMDIDSVNYYGPMSSPLSDANYANVTYIMRGVTYTGPQVAYIGHGGVEYYDSDFVIDGSAFTVSEEFAQCNRVTFGGAITIRHAPYASVNMFPFEGQAATRAIIFKAGADVRINTTRPFFSGGTTPFTIEEGASVMIESTTTLSPSLVYASPFTVGSNANFTYIQTAKNGSVSTIYCNGDFTVSQGASVQIEARHSSPSRLIYFSTTNARLRVTDPERFLLRSTGAGLIHFASTSTLELQGGQINYWKTPPSTDDPGGFADIPTYSWRKNPPSGEAVLSASISGGTTNTLFPTAGTGATNLDGTELEGKPLSELLLYSAYAFAIGSLPLSVDTITDDAYPIQGISAPGAKIIVSYTVDGMDYALPGTAGEDGKFSIETPAAIPPDETVTIRTNTPFLISETVQAAVDAGKLVLEAPPEQLAFAMSNKVSQYPLLFGRAENNWSLQVNDTRVRKTSWRIYAAISGSMAAETGHTLPDAVVFRDEADMLHVLNDEPKQIWLNETGAASVTVRWAADKGILMQRSTNPMYINEQYSAIIYWRIEAEE